VLPRLAIAREPNRGQQRSGLNGFTVDETGVDDAGPPDRGESPRPSDPASLRAAADMARDYIASLPAQFFPNLVVIADEFAFADADERFELLIDIFVDGRGRLGVMASPRWTQTARRSACHCFVTIPEPRPHPLAGYFLAVPGVRAARRSLGRPRPCASR